MAQGGCQFVLHLFDEVTGRECRHLLGERQHHQKIDTQAFYLLLFFLLRRQQLRTELRIEQLTGMTVEGNDHRCQMMELGIGNHTIDYLLMPCMNTVEHTNGGNAFQQHSCLFYVANNLH